MAVNPTGFPAPHLHPRRKNKKTTPAFFSFYQNAFGLFNCGDLRRTYWPKLMSVLVSRGGTGPYVDIGYQSRPCTGGDL